MRRWLDLASIAFLAGGAGLRLYQWSLGRGLWVDEAFLAVNVQTRGLGGLLQPLEYNQSAPYLFLAGTDLITSLFGYDERVLRLLPLAASLATLVLFWRLARTCLTPWAVPVAVAAAAFAYQLVYYAQEFKQYSFEILASVLVLHLTARLHSGRSDASRRFAWLWLAGAIVLFASHTAPFVLAGAGLTALFAKVRGSLMLSWRALLVGGGAWGALFAVNYLVFIHPASTNPFMRQFWAFAYPPPPVSAEGLRAWYLLLNEYLGYLGYSGLFKVVFAGLGLAGVVAALRTRNPALLASVTAIACFGLAVLAGLAPFHGRLTLFLFLPALLLAAGGLSLAGPRTSWMTVPRALAVLLLLFSAFGQIRRSTSPILVPNARETIHYLVEHRQADEPVHVIHHAQPSLRFYRSAHEDVSAHYDFGGDHRVWGPGARERTTPMTAPDLDIAVREISRLTTAPRFWVLTAHRDQVVPDLLAKIERDLGYVPIKAHKVPGAGAYLFARAP